MSVPPNKAFSGQSVHTATTTTPFSLATDNHGSFSHTNDDDDDDFLSMCSSNEGVDVLGDPSPPHFGGWAHLQSGKIVRSRLFKRGVLFNILLVSVLMGLATVDSVREDPTARVALERIVRFFRFLFTLEILLDIIHYQRRAFQMGWILFDVVVVTLSWTVSLSILVVRSFRLIRALRKATGVSDLKYLVKCILRVIPKIVAILFVLLLVFYIFTVIFTDLYQDLYVKGLTSENYFGRMDRTAFTLFRIMTLDNWTEIAQEVMAVYPWSCVFFVAFIVTTSFFFGALVVAAMTDSFTSIGRDRMMRALDDPNAVSIQGSKSQEIAKLEEKLIHLSNTVETLVQLQRATQESLDQLIQGKQGTVQHHQQSPLELIGKSMTSSSSK